MSFQSEVELMHKAMNSDFIQEIINQDNMKTYYENEAKGLFGIPDLIITKKPVNNTEVKTIAFEMKLSKWKRALIQAFRYKAFAELSYVMMDNKKINPALKNIESFKNSNIGLLSIDIDGNVFIHYTPTKEIPYNEVLEKKLHERIRENLN